MSDGSTQIKPWVFFLSTGVLLIAGIVVIASRLRPAESQRLVEQVAELENFKKSGDAAWTRAEARAEVIAKRSEEAGKAAKRALSGAKKELAERIEKCEGTKEDLKMVYGKVQKLADWHAGASVQLQNQKGEIAELEEQVRQLQEAAEKHHLDAGKLGQLLKQVDPSVLDAMPSGTILTWLPPSGQRQLPRGWSICDGQNGTPDLRGRVLRGVGTLGEAGQREGGNSPLKLLVPPGTKTSDPQKWRYVSMGGPGSNSFLGRAEIGPAEAAATRPPAYTVVYIMKTGGGSAAAAGGPAGKGASNKGKGADPDEDEPDDEDDEEEEEDEDGD